MKFTANRARARIEFGALPNRTAPEPISCATTARVLTWRTRVICSALQRLHDQSEFRGTGIGLHVQRVIHRHRVNLGRGAVNHGATFCFT